MRVAAAPVVYFTALGVGFMVVEVPLIQKLILVLGHPTHALTVVLFSLLLGGGVGSYLTGRISDGESGRASQMICLGVGVTVLTLAWFLGGPYLRFLELPFVGRVLCAGGLSFVLGFPLGMPFPLGLRALGEMRPHDIPWMWGVNGIASVLGSLLAACGAKLIGFQMVVVTGAAVYVLAGLVGPHCWRSRTGEATGAENPLRPSGHSSQRVGKDSPH